MNQTTEIQAKHPEHTLRKKNRRRSFLLGFVILICGFVLGSGVTIIAVQHMLLSVIHDQEHSVKRIMRKVRWHLDLSEEQAQQVESIIAKRKKELTRIRDEALPKVNKELDLMRDEVAHVLAPEQARKWKKGFERHRKRWVPKTSSAK